jgi:hypothetical protein
MANFLSLLFKPGWIQTPNFQDIRSRLAWTMSNIASQRDKELHDKTEVHM